MPVDVTVTRFFGRDTVAVRPDLVSGVPLYLLDATGAPDGMVSTALLEAEPSGVVNSHDFDPGN